MLLVPLLSWYLTITVFGILALPLAFRLFQNLPDRGIAFTKPLGLLALGFVYWLLGSLNLLANDNTGLLLAALVLAGAEIALLRKQGFVELKEWLSGQRRLLLAFELLFMVAFAGWAIIRATNPRIYGTEQPMDFMFLNSILKSPSFPLQDAWLSGHGISYYYFGYLLVAIITRATGTLPSVGYNLGLALLFALITVTAAGFLLNLIALVKAEKADRENRPHPRLTCSFWPALLAPVIVLLVGNLYGALEFVHDNGLVADLQIPAIWYDYGYAPDLSQVKSLQDMSIQPGLQAGTLDLWTWLDLKQLGPQAIPARIGLQWDLPMWFYAARVVHDRNLIGVETEAIDEVPAFSFLLGDLHPHLMALPFDILAAALAFEWLLAGRRKASLSADHPENRPFRPTWEKLVVSAIVLGSLIILNTWDFPVYWFLAVAGWTVGAGSILGFRQVLQSWKAVARMALILLVGCLLFYFPFFITFQSQAGGILPNLIYPTRFQQTLVMFAPVLAGALGFLIWIAHRTRKGFSIKLAILTALGLLLALILAAAVLTLAGLLNPGTLKQVTALVSPLTLGQAFDLMLQRRLVDSPTAILAVAIVGLVVAVIAGSYRLSSGGEDSSVEPNGRKMFLPGLPSIWLCLLMILTGGLLVAGPEFVYLRDSFGTRMNTIFKFYFQVWALWGMAAAFGIWYIFSHAKKWTRAVFSTGMVLLILLGMVYLPGGLLSKVADYGGQLTLDGMAYFAQWYPDDWAAIQWLDANASPDSVILEGSQGEYWQDGRSSRFSMATGLPTLMGWYGHELQWRGASYFATVAGRSDDIQTIYQTRDWQTAENLLNKYNVEYVIVSSLEMTWYRPVDAVKFQQRLVQVFQSGDVTIYRR